MAGCRSQCIWPVSRPDAVVACGDGRAARRRPAVQRSAVRDRDGRHRRRPAWAVLGPAPIGCRPRKPTPPARSAPPAPPRSRSQTTRPGTDSGGAAAVASRRLAFGPAGHKGRHAFEVVLHDVTRDCNAAVAAWCAPVVRPGPGQALPDIRCAIAPAKEPSMSGAPPAGRGSGDMCHGAYGRPRHTVVFTNMPPHIGEHDGASAGICNEQTCPSAAASAAGSSSVGLPIRPVLTARIVRSTLAAGGQRAWRGLHW